MSVECKPSSGHKLRTLMGVQVAAAGSFVPDDVVTNADLARLGCDAEWIVQRTGIRQRRHAPEDMATSDMAVEAGRRCLERSGVDPAEVDMLLLATLSPDHLMPASACSVQHRLDLDCPAVDMMAACAGFLYAMVTGMQFVATGCSRYVLVIGADCNTRIVDPADKKTWPLFGDGAGAVLLGPGSAEQGMLSFTLGSDGGGHDLLYRPMGGSRHPFSRNGLPADASFMRMNGRPVFKWAVRLIEETSQAVLGHADLASSDVDLWVLHQANTRIIDAAVEALEIDPAKVVIHMDRYGNTSAASVPIALDESLQAGRIQQGTTILMSGFGAGLSWGTAIFRW